MNKQRGNNLLKLMLVIVILFPLYIHFLGGDTVKSSQVLSGIVPEQLGGLQLDKSGVDYELGECELAFYSYKELKEVTPPNWFINRVGSYECEQVKWLSRLAYYESGYNENASNGAFSGLYQVGKSGANLTSLDSTLGWCYENGVGGSDEDCALWLVKWDARGQFEVVDKYWDSFRDLIIN